MKSTIWILVMVLTMFSCKKMEETIYDTPSVDNSIKTVTDIALVLGGNYGNLQHADLYKKEIVKMLELSGDNLAASGTEFNLFSQKVYEPGSGPISAVYSKYFSIINNCNFLLEKVELLKLDSASTSTATKINQIAGVEGEIRFFRAFAYFDLVRMFGGVPLRTQSTNINGTFYVARNTTGEIYDLIFSDLKLASTYLLDKTKTPVGGLGLANKGAAQSMMALASLTYGNYLDRNDQPSLARLNYASAKLYADSVLQLGGYKLIDNYADLWDVDNEQSNYTSEVIFGIRFTRERNGTSSSAKGSEYAPRFLPNTMGGVTGNLATGGIGSGTYRVQPWLYDFYNTGEYAGDYRSEATFLTSWFKTNSTTTTYVTYPLIPATGQSVETPNGSTTVDGRLPYIRKYIDGKGLESSNHENDMFVIRLAEVYLIKAEAENELNGPTNIAYGAFNQLRARARKANGTYRTTPADLTPGLSKDQFRKKIFDERGLEFIGECKRWFDLVRMKGPNGTGTMYEYMFKTYLPTLKPGLPLYNKTTKKWDGGVTDSISLAPYNPKFLLFPIPQRERDMNVKLTQNNGY